MSDIDTLLDSSIDDLADLPAFAIYPSGAHRVTIKFERKEVNKHPCVEMKMKLVETVELANPTSDVAPEAGTESSCLFMLDNEFGQGNFKAIMKPLAQACGTGSLGETMEAAAGMEVVVAIKTKPDRKDPDTLRMNVNKLIV